MLLCTKSNLVFRGGRDLSRGRSFFACALLLAFAGLARAQDEPLPSPPDTNPPEVSPPPEKKPEPPSKDEEPPEKPYVEGWHSGSPPGEHVILRYDMWRPDLDRGAEFEFGKHRPRVGVVTTKELDYPRREVVPGGGVEVYTGKMGWFSFDYWQLDLSGRAFALDAPHVVNHTSFAQGEVVTGETSQHYAKLGDGYDVRYRIPLGDDVSFDIMFAPILLLAIRQESIDVRSLQAFKRGGGEYTSIVLVPGLRLGVDLHLP